MLCNSFQSLKNIINTTVYTDLVCIMDKYMYTCCKLLSNSLYDLTDYCTVNKTVAAPMQYEAIVDILYQLQSWCVIHFKV